MDVIVDRFAGRLVRMLPLLLGSAREDVIPLWVRTCELFGTTAAKRGLAAGEVIEEFHLLRELLIRELFREPPSTGPAALSLREILRLNRALDSGVTHASVGHTDAMFFEFFESDGETPPLSGQELARETGAQLDAIGRELMEVLGADSGADFGR